MNPRVSLRLILAYLANVILGLVSGTLLAAAFFVSDPAAFIILLLAGLFTFTRIPVIAYMAVPAAEKTKKVYRWAEKDRIAKYLVMLIWIALGLISGGILNYVHLNKLRKNGALL